MATKTARLTAAVEHYLTDLQRIRASGSATGERSSYGPLANLLNAIGGALKPKVFCVGGWPTRERVTPTSGSIRRGRCRRGSPGRGRHRSAAWWR